VLTACKNVHIRHPKEHVPYALYIPGEDHENYDLSVHFETATNFIHQSRQETNILVHCMAGVSRSVTLVLAYLMKHMGMNYHQAYSLVQRNRNKVNLLSCRSTPIRVSSGSCRSWSRI
jgi:protein-tyrosine phosphatase